MKKNFWIIIISSVLIFACSQNTETKLTEFTGRTQGTTYSIKIVDSQLAENKSLQKTVHSHIDSLLVDISNQMSTWQKDSEISQFNLSESTDWFKVSKDFGSVVENSQKLSEISNGAFDITIGSLVNIWGFGPVSRDGAIPSEEEILNAKSLCDYKKISFNNEELAIKKEVKEISIDLSSIAQGFTVDKLYNYLMSAGYNDFLVEVGGEVKTSGQNHNGEKWKIGISVPDGSFDIQKIISLENMSVSTSGDYRDYFEKDGMRYSHTIDPRTGKPITHSLASVTVVCESCEMADGFATAIDVLGPEAGYELAVKEKLPVLLIVKTDNGFQEKMTTEFESLFKK